jgi:hypothetical protein
LSAVQPEANPTAAPTDTRRPLPATYTPAPTATLRLSPTPSGLPAALADFPLSAGTRVQSAENQVGSAFLAAESNAAVVLSVTQNPADLDAFYQKELTSMGWTLRYVEPNRVGGFIQSWKKGLQFLTLEYHLIDQKPVIDVNLKMVNPNKALAVLLGFPLPNGTEVTGAEGSSIDLYVPLNIDAASQYFLDKMAVNKWRVAPIDFKLRCFSLACQEPLAQDKSLVLLPAPTPDKNKGQAYRVTMPDRTLLEISLQPHRSSTRASILVKWTNPARAGLPVPFYPYPGSTVTSAIPGVMMFETPDSLKSVTKFYEDALAGMDWQATGVFIDQADRYSKTWSSHNNKEVVTLNFSTADGKTYATLICNVCIKQ